VQLSVGQPLPRETSVCSVRPCGLAQTISTAWMAEPTKFDSDVQAHRFAKMLDSGEKFTSDLPYKQPESTKSSGQRELQAQACENMLRTRSAISNNPGAREVIPSTSVGWIFVTKESPSP
jgi:hypothetical protein